MVNSDPLQCAFNEAETFLAPVLSPGTFSSYLPSYKSLVVADVLNELS